MTMTKNPLKPLEDPPAASSSEEDDLETSADEEEEEDEVSSSEEDKPRDPILKVTVAPPGKSTTVSSAAATGDKQGSDSDSGSETETDSDSETEGAPNPPISGSGKAIAVTTVKKKKEDPPSSATLALPAVKSAMKRPRPVSEGTTSRDVNASKRAKKVTSGEEEEESIKKPAFQRLWCEDDEIALLQGMIDFKGETGKSPYEDSNGFYDFIKTLISFEVSKNQLMDKRRSMKKKFMGKEVRNGVEPSFSKAHDQKSYELSKFIWGPGGIATETNGSAKKSQSKSKSKAKKLDSGKQELLFEDDQMLIDGEGDLRKSDWFDKSFLVQAISGFGVGEFSVKENWGLVSVENKKMVEDKLKLLQDKEIEFVLENTGFLHEVMSMIAESSKKSKSLIAAESSKKSKSMIAAESSKKSKSMIAAESSKKSKSMIAAESSKKSKSMIIAESSKKNKSLD